MDAAWEWLVAAADPQSSLAQYGAIGVLAMAACSAVVALFKRQISAHERDIARADKAEEQLAALNALIRDRLVEQLTRATDTLGRTAERLGDQRRVEERRSR